MFENLTNFSYKRNWKEAFGFYLAFLLLVVVLSFFLGSLGAILGVADSFDQGIKIGAVTSTVFCLIISSLLLKEKKLFKKFGYILLVLCSGILTLFGGGLFGLIIPAFITTRQS